MYMWRVYQSPNSGADCGPQWDQMPNLASRYQAGTYQFLSDSRAPLKGPGVISNCAPAARALENGWRSDSNQRLASREYHE
jgi:hypothetical protein